MSNIPQDSANPSLPHQKTTTAPAAGQLPQLQLHLRQLAFATVAVHRRLSRATSRRSKDDAPRVQIKPGCRCLQQLWINVPAAWPMSRILGDAKRWRAQRRLYYHRRCRKCCKLDAEPMYDTCTRVYWSQLTDCVPMSFQFLGL